MTGKKKKRNTSNQKKQSASPNPQEKKRGRNRNAGRSPQKKDEELIEIEDETIEIEDDPSDDDDDDDDGASLTPTKLAPLFNKQHTEKEYSGNKQIWSNMISNTKASWDRIDVQIRNNHEPYQTSDIAAIIPSLVSEGKEAREIDESTMMTAEGWHQIFTEVFETETDLAKSDRGVLLMSFGVQLALTAPHQLFSSGTTWDKQGLRATAITNAWTGAYIYFGAPWKNHRTFKEYYEQTFITGKEIARITKQVQEHNKDDEAEEIDDFSETEEEKATSETEETEKEETEIEKENTGKDKAKEHEEEQESDENEPGKGNGQNKETPGPGDDKDKPEEDEDGFTPVVNKNNKEKRKKSVGFGNKNFLSRPLEKPRVKKKLTARLKGDVRKYTSFFKLKTAIIRGNDDLERENEFTKAIRDLLNKVWQYDPTALVYGWDEEGDTKPLKKSGKFPETPSMLSSHLSSTYIKRGDRGWIRMRIAHDKKADTFEADQLRQWCRERDMAFYRERLQVKITTKAGWMLGSHHEVFNPRDLEEALEALPEMQGIPFELRVEFHRIEPKVREDSKACHVHTAWDKVAKCRKALNKIYGKNNKDGYPLGKNMRFIPNTLDPRFIVPRSTQQKIRKCVSKQKKFCKDTQVKKNYNILGLDYYEVNLKTTLRQVIMGIRSREEPDRNLFVAVDKMVTSNTVLFAYHKDFAAEASMLIPALPVLLEAKMGARIWNWFDDEARDITDGYYWDDVKGVCRQEDDIEDWEGFEASDDEEDDEEETREVIVEPFQINMTERGRKEFRDDGSTVASWKTFLGNKANTIAEGNEDAEMADAATAATELVDVDMTSGVAASSPSNSTLTSSSEWNINEIQAHMQADPNFMFKMMQMMMQQTQNSHSPPPASENDETALTQRGGEGS